MSIEIQSEPDPLIPREIHPHQDSANQDPDKDLVKGLGLTSATMLVMGSMIGSGIFIVSAEISREVDSPALLIAAWVVAGFMTVVCALTYGELAAMMPRAGGQYVYLRESLGPLWGFLYGWTLFLVIETGTIAAVCVAFGKFLGIFFPAVSSTHWLWHIAHVPAIPVGPMVLGNRALDVKTDLHGELADPAAFAKRVHLLWLGVGTDEPAMMKTGLERLNTSLDQAKVKHVFYESPGTSHEWQTWRRDLKEFAPRLFQ